MPSILYTEGAGLGDAETASNLATIFEAAARIGVFIYMYICIYIWLAVCLHISNLNLNLSVDMSYINI